MADFFLPKGVLEKVDRKIEENLTPGPVGPMGPQGGFDPNGYDPGYNPEGAGNYNPPDPTEVSPGILDVYGAAQNATRGFFTGSDPVDSVQRAYGGLMRGDTFPGAHYGFARNLPEGEIQDAADRFAAGLTDPLTLAFPGGGALARASIFTGLAGGEAARQGTRLYGGGEDAQNLAYGAGAIVGGVGPSLVRPAARLAGALDRAINPATLPEEAQQFGRAAGQDRLDRSAGVYQYRLGRKQMQDAGGVSVAGPGHTERVFDTPAGRRRMFDPINDFNTPEGALAGAADYPRNADGYEGWDTGSRARAKMVVQRIGSNTPLPEPRDGFVRLFRGDRKNGPSGFENDTTVGKWFTAEPELASTYADMADPPPSRSVWHPEQNFDSNGKRLRWNNEPSPTAINRLYYVDVPIAEVNAARDRALAIGGRVTDHIEGSRRGSQFILSDEWAAKAQPAAGRYSDFSEYADKIRNIGGGAEQDLNNITPELMTRHGLTEREISAVERAQMGQAKPADKDTLMTALSKVFKGMEDPNPPDTLVEDMGHFNVGDDAAQRGARLSRFEEMQQAREQFGTSPSTLESNIPTPEMLVKGRTWYRKPGGGGDNFDVNTLQVLRKQAGIEAAADAERAAEGGSTRWILYGKDGPLDSGPLHNMVAKIDALLKRRGIVYDEELANRLINSMERNTAYRRALARVTTTDALAKLGLSRSDEISMLRQQRGPVLDKLEKELLYVPGSRGGSRARDSIADSMQRELDLIDKRLTELTGSSDNGPQSTLKSPTIKDLPPGASRFEEMNRARNDFALNQPAVAPDNNDVRTLTTFRNHLQALMERNATSKFGDPDLVDEIAQTQRRIRELEGNIGGGAEIPGGPNKPPLFDPNKPPTRGAVGSDAMQYGPPPKPEEPTPFTYRMGAQAPDAHPVGLSRVHIPGEPRVDIPGSTSGGFNAPRGTVGSDVTGGVPPFERKVEIPYDRRAHDFGRFAATGAGAATGAATGDDPEDRFHRALIGGTIGYAGYTAAKAVLKPQGGLNGALFNKVAKVARGFEPAVIEDGVVTRGARGATIGSFTTKELDDLHTFVRSASPDYATGMSADTALTKLMTGQRMEVSDWSALDSTVGRDTAKWKQAYLNGDKPLPSTAQKIGAAAVDVLNAPRTIKSSWDASAPLRQGLMLGAGHPAVFTKNVGTMFKAMWSEDAAQEIVKAIDNSPNKAMYDKYKLYIASLDGQISQREEAFMSSFADKLPGVRGSERGYVSFLNKMRTDIFDNVVDNWRGTGKTDKDYQGLANFLNAASGRGRLPGPISDWAPVLNAVFFSPRFFASRIEAHALLFKSSPAVRNMIAKDLLAFYGLNMAILGSMKASGLADVDLTPNSADFGKVRIGNWRYDFLAGNQQIMRFVAEMQSGARKNTNTGEQIPSDRTETLMRFLRGKLAPIPAEAVNVATGKDLNGVRTNTPGYAEHAILQSVAPIFVTDLEQALKEGGYAGGFMVAPALLGAGVQNYGGTPMDKVSPGGRFYDLTRHEQQALKEQHPDLWDATVATGSDEQQRAESLRKEFRRYQEADDAKLQDSPAYIDEWKKNFGDRQIELGAHIKEIYASRPPSKARNVAEQYINNLNDWKNPNGTVDFNRVEEWRATLSEKDNEYIDSETGLGSTPAAREYRKVGKDLRNAGFYTDTRDIPWQDIQDLHGVQGDTYQDWYNEEVKQWSQMYADVGENQGVALTKATQRVDTSPTVKMYTKLRSMAEVDFAMNHPELADRAGEYRYTSLSKKEINAIRMAGVQ